MNVNPLNLFIMSVYLFRKQSPFKNPIYESCLGILDESPMSYYALSC